MQADVAWWILAAVLVGVELASGTFYLLVYGSAAAVAGVTGTAPLELPAVSARRRGGGAARPPTSPR